MDLYGLQVLVDRIRVFRGRAKKCPKTEGFGASSRVQAVLILFYGFCSKYLFEIIFSFFGFIFRAHLLVALGAKP
jgi:hypothetical protein